MRYFYGIIIALFIFFAFVAIWTRAIGYTGNINDIPSTFSNLGALFIIPLAIIIIWYVTWFVVKHGRLDRPRGVRRVYGSRVVKKSLSEQSPKVLYFRDNIEAAKRFATKLTAGGFDVVHFQSPGADPIQLIKKERPALIITDIMMTGRDGLELARLIAARPDLKALPIIGVSDIGSASVRRQALAAGMTDFFSLRQLTADEIVNHLAQYLTVNSQK